MRWISLWLSLACQSLLAAEWFPYPVQADGRMLDYRPLPAAAQPWRICALLPHGKDRYWWGVAWGLDQEAQRLGVRLGIYEAGGYEHGDVQLEQFDRCVAEGADAFVVASINTYDLCSAAKVQLQAGRPVIDLINRLDCTGLSAHSRVDFADMTRATLDYLVRVSGGRPIRVGWLPGPADAGWVQDAERGLREALAGKAITLADLPPEIRGEEGGAPVVTVPDSHSEELAESLSPEGRRLVNALERNGGHMGRAAASLGISRTTLWRRLKRLGIDREEL